MPLQLCPILREPVFDPCPRGPCAECRRTWEELPVVEDEAQARPEADADERQAGG